MSETESEQKAFRIGDRVRLSEEGLKRKGSRRGGDQGVVVGLVRGSTSLRVHFDGYKGPSRLHPKYIELDPAWRA